jgi:hypothetical protein
MNLTQFAANLLEALRKDVDSENWMERMENVLYALEYGKKRPPEMDWDAMQREADMEDVEYSSRVLMNPISHCPPEIEIQKKRLEEEMIDHLKSLDKMLSSGELADGRLPFVGWPDPWGIFERCKDFAERIAEEETPSETSTPPVVGESDEGSGQVPQGCEADKKPNWSRVYSKKQAAAMIGISVADITTRQKINPQSVVEITREKWLFDRNDPLFMRLESVK